LTNLDVIEEEEDDEEEHKSMTESKGRSGINMTKIYGETQEIDEEANEEKLLKEKFENLKKQGVKRIISMEYSLSLWKAIRIISYVLAILIALLSVLNKSNVWGGLLIIATATLSFRKFNYRNLKWYSLVVCLLIGLQFASSFANFSPSNSPSVFPTPFNDRGIQRPISTPIYREFGNPITEPVNVGPESGEFNPTKWAFYLGFIISETRYEALWIDLFVILI
jgi:hypothetical protein